MDVQSPDQLRLREEEEQATRKRARLLGVRYTDSRKVVPNVELIKNLLTVPEMHKLGIAPLTEGKGSLVFAVNINTPQTELRVIRQRFSDYNVAFVLISSTGFRELMLRYDPPKEITYDDVKIASAGESSTLESVSKTFETVKSDDILDYLITQADRLNASDIHIEVEKDYVRLRLRIDGTLHTIAKLAPEKHRQLSSSIAVKADISTSSPTAQTGHITYEVQAHDGKTKSLNMRIETSPTLYGQDSVIRLFNFQRELLRLENLG
ncbi:MAG: ATPase, T2SS/T4P/T4SS family, partial [Candidatus Saccharimonadales bacterium]|nr:ATPase, T2SS/T4P/T4SS family [Candidatus Saccharimonadales bacterium]